jgi:hypothetical protein
VGDGTRLNGFPAALSRSERPRFHLCLSPFIHGFLSVLWTNLPVLASISLQERGVARRLNEEHQNPLASCSPAFRFIARPSSSWNSQASIQADRHFAVMNATPWWMHSWLRCVESHSLSQPSRNSNQNADSHAYFQILRIDLEILDKWTAVAPIHLGE